MDYFSYSINYEMPQNIDFDALQAALQMQWPQILYTRYQWNEYILDVVCNASLEDVSELTSYLSTHSELFLLSTREDALPQTTEEALISLRKERNNKLTICDWTQLSDAPLTDEQKMIWRMYRQCLRDLPETTTDPFNPLWPTIPQPI